MFWLIEDIVFQCYLDWGNLRSSQNHPCLRYHIHSDQSHISLWIKQHISPSSNPTCTYKETHAFGSNYHCPKGSFSSFIFFRLYNKYQIVFILGTKSIYMNHIFLSYFFKKNYLLMINTKLMRLWFINYSFKFKNNIVTLLWRLR